NYMLFFILPPAPTSTLFPYTTLFRSDGVLHVASDAAGHPDGPRLVPVLPAGGHRPAGMGPDHGAYADCRALCPAHDPGRAAQLRSEEHTSELQSQSNLVCRLLLEKKN